MNTTAGKRNRLVELRRHSGTDAGWGQPTSDPAAMILVAKLWVHIRHLSGTEALKAGTEQSVVRASLRGNYRTDVTNGMELWHGTTRYRVQAVLPDEVGRQFTDYTCEVVT